MNTLERIRDCMNIIHNPDTPDDILAVAEAKLKELIHMYDSVTKVEKTDVDKRKEKHEKM